MLKTKIIKVDPKFPDESILRFAGSLLKEGGLVAFPTETVYGIGANFLDEKAMTKLRNIKNRPPEKPFTLHIASLEAINQMQCAVSPLAKRLMENFWPGPLTIILKAKDKKIGFRMPKNVVAKSVILESEVPVALPSANLSGEKPATRCDEISLELDGKIDLILDGGPTVLGQESTVVDLSGNSFKILRKGAISESKIEEIEAAIS
ncbi:MAG: L-threonylcarbamoyladenylate synthase [Candidatus Omnitrophota bacterium]